MVANLQTVAPTQDILYAVEQVIAQRVTFASPANVVLGVIPAGAVPVAAAIITDTAFNAGTTNTMDLGFDDGVAAAAPTAIVAAQACGPVANAPVTLAATCLPVARATKITARYNQSGGAATAGSALVVVRYVVPR